ncbi:DNA repair protein REV1 isoform X2 [Venturia canescens]|uniref:DNA repair protein REV1 isoform X2 n=1 Tax=Venturia canescens TaxID=32260 RepID=UPI001C9CDF47|nr:DNA repair protein REV1 isoform X2 [Venturia canescens]
MSSDKKKKSWAENGLEDWGAYMAAKKEKLEDQFQDAAKKEFQDATHLFSGIAIFVNGYTNPCADELKRLMMAHGGIYHHYMRSKVTTHIIASNLPYSKIIAYRKSQNPLPICKPEWITDSISAQRLLDWRAYVLYSNCSKTQPPLRFNEKTHNLFSGMKPDEKMDLDINEKKGNIRLDSTKGGTEKLKEIENRSEGSALMSTKNPEFLSEFYNNSRLHHISTMGMTFKDYVTDLREKSEGKLEGLERLIKEKEEKGKKWLGGLKNEGCSDSEEDLFDSEDLDNERRKVQPNETCIMHIDMDCFFVSVGLRNQPELKGFPIAVAHARGNGASSSKRNSEEDRNDEIKELGSMSEIASCSYEARKAGVKNGMFLGQALKLCPNLRTIKYDFEGYKEVSYALYDTVASYTLMIEAVSCDEMYADVTTVLAKTGLRPLQFANIIRDEINTKTRCPVSTGFGCNKLQARLATRSAKPNGQFHLENRRFRDHIASTNVRDLPGVGYSTTQLLNKIHVRTCSDLQKISLPTLQKEFGKKTGELLYNMCRGIDNTKLTIEHVRKSVSAEVNYGIRFETPDEAQHFLRKLCHEVCTRLERANSKGRSVTLKLMVRAKDAPRETLKYMGHGICDNISKSKNFIAPVDDPVVITREVISLWDQMQQRFEDIRGVGIQISRLESMRGKTGGIMDFLGKPKRSNVERQIKEKKQVVCTGTSNDIEASNDRVEKAARSANEERRGTNENEIGINRGTEEIAMPDEIDESVLLALPEEIKREIMESRSSKMEKVPKILDEPTNSSNANDSCLPTDQRWQTSDYDESVLKELPTQIRNEVLAGRPAKINNETKKRNDSTQTLQNNYFKDKKSIAGRTSEKVTTMPPIEEIDMSVLIELPEDIRNEIINEYKMKKQNEKREQQLDIPEKNERPKLPTENKKNEVASIAKNAANQVAEEVNLSFSQIDPDFLAALSDDVKNDVEMYCMVKKKEKLAKTRNLSSNDSIAKHRNLTKLNKKTGRPVKTKTKFDHDFFKIPYSRKNAQQDSVPAKINQNPEPQKSGNSRFLENKLHTLVDGQFGASLDQTQEILSHQSSYIGKKAKTEEQEMVTSLVNHLFTLPRQQMHHQNWELRLA